MKPLPVASLTEQDFDIWLRLTKAPDQGLHLRHLWTCWMAADRRDAALMLLAVETRRLFGPTSFCVENIDHSDLIDCAGPVLGSRLWCMPQAT